MLTCYYNNFDALECSMLGRGNEHKYCKFGTWTVDVMDVDTSLSISAVY